MWLLACGFVWVRLIWWFVGGMLWLCDLYLVTYSMLYLGCFGQYCCLCLVACGLLCVRELAWVCRFYIFAALYWCLCWVLWFWLLWLVLIDDGAWCLLRCVWLYVLRVWFVVTVWVDVVFWLCWFTCLLLVWCALSLVFWIVLLSGSLSCC